MKKRSLAMDLPKVFHRTLVGIQGVLLVWIARRRKRLPGLSLCVLCHPAFACAVVICSVQCKPALISMLGVGASYISACFAGGARVSRACSPSETTIMLESAQVSKWKFVSTMLAYNVGSNGLCVTAHFFVGQRSAHGDVSNLLADSLVFVCTSMS